MTVVAKRDCEVLIAAEANRSAYDMLHWEKVDGGGIRYSDRTETRMDLYRRRFRAGQQAVVPQYGWTGTIVLLPK